MTEVTVKRMDVDQPDDDAPPPGTAIVRPLRHVQAVRERYMLRFADPSAARASRSARAWAWALGETATAPVTDQQTATPPCRPEIEAEIAVAEDRRLRGDRADRADAAATVLCWLIGDDDHLPVRGNNPGELVGGFGDVVRSREQIADVLAVATEARHRYISVEPDNRLDADYLDGVAATLAWILGGRSEAPITRMHSRQLTRRDVKTERLHAADVIEQASNPWMVDRLPPRWLLAPFCCLVTKLGRPEVYAAIGLGARAAPHTPPSRPPPRPPSDCRRLRPGRHSPLARPSVRGSSPPGNG